MECLPNRPAFYLDTQICTGCKTCVVACKDKNDLDPGVRWRRVVEYTGGEWLHMPDGTYRQDVFSYYISVSCNHCSEAYRQSGGDKGCVVTGAWLYSP